MEDISHTHIVSLTYKLKTSAKDTNGLFIDFDRDRLRKQRELTKNKIVKRKYHVIFILRDIFSCVEQQQKETFGLGYKLTVTRKTDNSVLIKDRATNIGKIKINIIEWYVPYYTLSISNQGIVSKQILSEVATAFQYVERNVSIKKVNIQKLDL